MLIFDAHLDLSMNALEWNRDLTRSVAGIRAAETQRETHQPRAAGGDSRAGRGAGTVALPDMRRGHVGMCVATMIARYTKPGSTLPGFSAPEIAWAQTQGQLAWYRAMEEAGQMALITDRASLERMVDLWTTQPPSQGEEQRPIGYVLSLEGADSILSPAHLQRAHDAGLRALGPAHYGPGTYAHGTHSEGGLGRHGVDLLQEMQRLGIILDATHLCDTSFWEAMDHFQGRVWASHSNCRSLVPHERQFSDEQLQVLIDRGAVIGGALDAWMMIPGWVRGETLPETSGVCLDHLVDHLDHVCQLAGNARHAAIGSDLDGGFGREQSPGDLDTIADLQRVPELLSRRGYDDEAIAGIMHGNWIRFLSETWS
jgi:membrane dipeptidase